MWWIPGLIERTMNGCCPEYKADNSHDGWENKHLGIKAEPSEIKSNFDTKVVFDEP